MVSPRLGERVRALRAKRGLTQKALAAKLELSEVAVRKIENGSRRPSLLVLERLARALSAEVRLELVERRRR